MQVQPSADGICVILPAGAPATFCDVHAIFEQSVGRQMNMADWVGCALLNGPVMTGECVDATAEPMEGFPDRVVFRFVLFAYSDEQRQRVLHRLWRDATVFSARCYASHGANGQHIGLMMIETIPRYQSDWDCLPVEWPSTEGWSDELKEAIRNRSTHIHLRYNGRRSTDVGIAYCRQSVLCLIRRTSDGDPLLNRRYGYSIQRSDTAHFVVDVV
jgi:hypothetical protein